MNSTREQLIAICHKWVDGKITATQQLIQDLQASSNEETKSSAGDKYETARAMAQLEIEKNAAQLSEFQNLKQTLNAIPAELESATIVMGSIVATNKGKYFLSISSGKQILNGQEYFCLSIASPLGSRMIGKKQGDSVSFNNNDWLITNVE